MWDVGWILGSGCPWNLGDVYGGWMWWGYDIWEFGDKGRERCVLLVCMWSQSFYDFWTHGWNEVRVCVASGEGLISRGLTCFWLLLYWVWRFGDSWASLGGDRCTLCYGVLKIGWILLGWIPGLLLVYTLFSGDGPSQGRNWRSCITDVRSCA